MMEIETKSVHVIRKRNSLFTRLKEIKKEKEMFQQLIQNYVQTLFIFAGFALIF